MTTDDPLPFLTDEHVPSVVITTLRAHGCSVVLAKEQYGERTVDRELLEAGAADDRVLLTNDRDFLVLGAETDHAGAIVYTTQDVDPGDFVGAIQRIDRYVDPEAMWNDIEWLEDWIS